MQRSYPIGQAIVYVDPKGVRHPALVKCWWAQWPIDTASSPDRARFPDLTDEAADHHKQLHQGKEPGCNLVWVSADVERNDNCGRQTEIATSVVHKGNQIAHGNYWCWSDE